MVVIRLSRGGRKKNPFYSVVVADSKKPRDGKFLEKLGYFNPSLNDKNKRSFFINSDRLKHWENNGAQSSPTVKRLLKIITQVNFINSYFVALKILSPFGIKGFSNYISFVNDFYLDESNKFYILKNSQYLLVKIIFKTL